MAKISLCMIVKEPKGDAFEDCWFSVMQYVDEVVVVTEDKKWIELVESEGIKYQQIKPFYYKWQDDFANARNFSFSKATNDIILWIDADDTIEHPEKLQEVAQLIEDGKLDWAWFEYIYEKDDQGNVLMRQWQPRMMRKGTGHWEMPIHEAFTPDKEVVQTMYQGIRVIHHTQENHRAEHGKRNLKILLADYEKNGIKTDPRILYYLGNTLLALEKFAEAIPFYHMHVEQCGWPEEKYFSLHYLSKTYSYIGQYEAAINMAMEATKIFPNWNLAYFDLAEYYTIQADTKNDKLGYKKAIEWTLIGLTKQKPDSKQYFSNDLDYTLMPLGRLADCYLQTDEYVRAFDIANRLHKQYPDNPLVTELYKTTKEVVETEDFVSSFVTVANKIGNTDRIKGAKLFDALPSSFDEDIRIQTLRQNFVPPKTWEANSVVIFCGDSLEEWAKPSLYTGIGGSETAVIYMAQELTKLGYKVTVYNKCGDYRGTYAGVEYLPYYHFNVKDNFNYLVSWRNPGVFNYPLKAKKTYLWLHDIAYPQYFSENALTKPDKILFLSKWHRDNLPELPEEKVFITNNGIDPEMFNGEMEKRPNSLIYKSSYDRGAVTLLRDIFPKIREAIPDATLDVCYGMANLEKEMHAFPHLKQLHDEILPLLNQEGVIHHGRIGHKELAELTKTTLLHIYPTEFSETNFMGSQESQAAGAYVLTTTQSGATPERLRFGEALEGKDIYTNKEFQQQFIDRAIELLQNPPILSEEKGQEIIDEFKWTTTAKSWDKELLNGTN